jgi:hypothetical protein
MKALIGKLGGRKWLIALFSTILIGLGELVGITMTPEKITGIAGIAAALILGQAHADAKTDGKTSTTTPD